MRGSGLVEKGYIADTSIKEHRGRVCELSEDIATLPRGRAWRVMPWKETDAMRERVELVLEWERRRKRQALGQKPPATAYQTSSRRYPRKLVRPDPEGVRDVLGFICQRCLRLRTTRRAASPRTRERRLPRRVGPCLDGGRAHGRAAPATDRAVPLELGSGTAHIGCQRGEAQSRGARRVGRQDPPLPAHRDGAPGSRPRADARPVATRDSDRLRPLRRRLSPSARFAARPLLGRVGVLTRIAPRPPKSSAAVRRKRSRPGPPRACRRRLRRSCRCRVRQSCPRQVHPRASGTAMTRSAGRPRDVHPRPPSQMSVAIVAGVSSPGSWEHIVAGASGEVARRCPVQIVVVFLAHQVCRFAAQLSLPGPPKRCRYRCRRPGCRRRPRRRGSPPPPPRSGSLPPPPAITSGPFVPTIVSLPGPPWQS